MGKERPFGASFCFPASHRGIGEARGKQQNAQIRRLWAAFGMSANTKSRFSTIATGRMGPAAPRKLHLDGAMLPRMLKQAPFFVGGCFPGAVAARIRTSSFSHPTRKTHRQHQPK